MRRQTVLCSFLLGVHAAGFAAAQATVQEGIALVKQRQYERARTTLEQVVAREPGNAEAHAYLGLVAINFDRDADRCITELEKAIELVPRKADYHVWVGGCYGTKAGSSGLFKAASWAKKSKAALEKAVEIDPESTEARLGLIQYYLDAPGIIGGSVKKAKEQADEVVKRRPFEGLLALASVADHENDAPRAEAYFRKAIATEPARGEGYNVLGYFLLRHKRIAEALTTFATYVELAPQEANPHDSLGDGFMAADKVDQALESYRKALLIDPSFASSQLGVARCYERKGMVAEAVQAYERFLTLEPRGRQANQARARLKELQKQK